MGIGAIHGHIQLKYSSRIFWVYLCILRTFCNKMDIFHFNIMIICHAPCHVANIQLFCSCDNSWSSQPPHHIYYIVFIIWKIQKKSYKNTCLQYFICKPSSNCDQTLIIKLAFWFKNFILYLKARKKQTKRDSLNEAFLILNAKRHKRYLIVRMLK